MTAAWPDVPRWDDHPEPDPSEQSWDPGNPTREPHTRAWEHPDAHYLSDRECVEAAAQGDTAAAWEAATRGLTSPSTSTT